MNKPLQRSFAVLFFIFFLGAILGASYIFTASGPVWAKIVTTLLILALVILGYVMTFVIPVSRPQQTILAYFVGVVLLLLIAWMLRFLGIDIFAK